jgi:hypothetical protein
MLATARSQLPINVSVSFWGGPVRKLSMMRRIVEKGLNRDQLE